LHGCSPFFSVPPSYTVGTLVVHSHTPPPPHFPIDDGLFLWALIFPLLIQMRAPLPPRPEDIWVADLSNRYSEVSPSGPLSFKGVDVRCSVFVPVSWLFFDTEPDLDVFYIPFSQVRDGFFLGSCFFPKICEVLNPSRRGIELLRPIPWQQVPIQRRFQALEFFSKSPGPSPKVPGLWDPATTTSIFFFFGSAGGFFPVEQPFLHPPLRVSLSFRVMAIFLDLKK